MFRCLGVQVFRCSGVQVFRCSGVQVFRCSGVWGLGFRCLGVGRDRNWPILFLVGGRRGGGPEGAEGWGPEGARSGAQNFAFFFPSPATKFVFSSLSGGLLVEFWWCFEAPEPSNVHVWSPRAHTHGPCPLGTDIQRNCFPCWASGTAASRTFENPPNQHALRAGK